MSYIFEHSHLASKPEVDLFSTVPTQASVNDGFHSEHMPITSLTDSGPIKFAISGDSNYYLDLNSSYILLEVKITKDDGDDIEAAGDSSPINNFGHSLFQQMDVSLNDVIVSNTSNLYHYRALLETLLSYSPEAKESQLTMGLYAKDTAGHMDNVGGDNAGLVARRAITGVSNTVQLVIRPHLDIFHQKRYILNGVDLKLKLTRNPNALILMSPGVKNGKVKISSASFFVRKVKINSGIQLQHIEQLDKHLLSAVYPLRKVEMKSFNISTGSLSYNQENLFQGILPKRIVIGMIDSQSFDGSYAKNPFNFQHMNLKYANLVVDGKSVPQKPLVSDFTNHNTLRNYLALLESTGNAFSDHSIGITRSDYDAGYTLLAFDLTPDLDESGCFHITRSGNIRLELKFSAGLAAPVNIICYSEFDSSIKIDKNRSVLTA